ncbi:MAG: polynucleotide adenylyltransferase PcnB [Sandaracinaceae bacterium]
MPTASPEAPSDLLDDDARPPKRARAPRSQKPSAARNGHPRPDVASRASTPEPSVHEVGVPLSRVDPDAAKVIRRLRRHDHEAYLVGGGVRDLLLDITPKDFDVATSARPAEVKSLFRNCRIIGRRFRLAHVLFGGGKIIEVATFRRDPQLSGTDPRSARRQDDVDLLIRQDNVFGEPHEDAVRRDFTINGLFLDTEEGKVIDYVGGMEDLAQREIRTIGAPDVRFREDPVRILRAIKFSARLDLGIAPDVYDAIVACRSDLARAARPRLLEELLRLLRGGAAHRSYWLMWETGALVVLLPQLAAHLDDDGLGAQALWGRLAAIDTMKRAGRLPSDAVLFAALMLGPIEEAMAGEKDPGRAYEGLMGDVLERLAVPRRMKERVRHLIGAQRRLRAGRLGSLPRRDYFTDATALFRLDQHARGERRPEWLDDPPAVEPEHKPRRRRRRRRRRDNGD